MKAIGRTTGEGRSQGGSVVDVNHVVDVQLDRKARH